MEPENKIYGLVGGRGGGGGRLWSLQTREGSLTRLKPRCKQTGAADLKGSALPADPQNKKQQKQKSTIAKIIKITYNS